MRVFHCDRCGAVVPFTTLLCPVCGVDIGYLSDRRDLCAIVPCDQTAIFRLEDDGDGSGPAMWRCLNAAWGCNWMCPVASGATWCRSCGLTRGRPDVGRPDAIAAWVEAEVAKRRLVHQLDELALPFESETRIGLAFDLVHLPGTGGITGHLDGVVTLDLAETDEAHRDQVRRSMGESFRTVLGHLRHEIGHFYFARLVAQTDEVARFRRLFGDERGDYAGAIDRYYGAAGAEWDRAQFVTAYAAAHPLEDWAETFAHYLHIVDVVDTAAAHGLVDLESIGAPTTSGVAGLTFAEILAVWRPLNTGLGAIADTLGARALYPFDPAGLVVEKLGFVHRQIGAHVERDRFYADR